MTVNKYKWVFAPYGKGSKGTCPNCKGYQSYRYYLDVEKGVLLSPNYGVCDRLSCSSANLSPYKVPPTEERNFTTIKSSVEEDDGTYNTLERSVVKKGLKHRYKDNLSKFLLKTFTDTKVVHKVLDKYCVTKSTALEGSTAFFQISDIGEVRSAKLIKYGKNGKRIKPSKEIKSMTWLHSLLNKKFKLRQCIFGEHLLKNWKYGDKVTVLESEKSCLIMSIVYPETTWVSVGSLYGLSEFKLNALKGKKVLFMPDKGEKANTIWKERVAEFPLEDWRVSDLLEQEKYNDMLEEGDDIADLALIANKSE